MHEGNAVLGKQRMELAERTRDSATGRLLDIPTETMRSNDSFQRAVVPKKKAHAIGQAALARPLVGDGVLLLRQRDAGDVDLEGLGEIDGKAARGRTRCRGRAGPAERKLRCDVALLGELRLLKVGDAIPK